MRPTRFIAGGESLQGAILVEGSKIIAVGRKAEREGHDSIQELDGTLMAGLIDLQVNGAGGRQVEEAQPEALDMIADVVRSGGAHAFLPTLVSAPIGELLDQISALAHWIDHWSGTGAQPLGIHLEGPFLEVAGAHREDCLIDPTPQAIDALLDAAQGWLKLVTLAPARAGASEAVRQLTAAGVCVALGHAKRTDQFEACVDAGARMVTHLFNAMGGLHHREPGMAGLCLAEPRLGCSLIADGIHVHPKMIQNAANCLGIDRLTLVTDCMAAAGMQDGTYALGGRDVIRAQGEVRDANGNLAGSAILMADAVRNYLNYVPDADAIDIAVCASANPARLIGAAGLGDLSLGLQPGLTLLSDDGEVRTL